MRSWGFSHRNRKSTSMKTILSLLLGLIILTPLHAQTVDEVILQYTKAMGGLEAFNKIESAKITGTLGSQGKNYPLTIQIRNGKSMRTDVDVNGQLVTNAYDKGKGWKLNPFEGVTTASEVTAADELALLKIQSSLANNLMDYKRRGHKVELAGSEELGGIKAFKVKLTSKDDARITTYFISSKDYMLLRSDSKQKVQGTEYDAQTFFSDTKDINGLKFSMHFLRKIEGVVFQEVTYSKVELNLPIDENIFKMPN